MTYRHSYKIWGDIYARMFEDDTNPKTFRADIKLPEILTPSSYSEYDALNDLGNRLADIAEKIKQKAIEVYQTDPLD